MAFSSTTDKLLKGHSVAHQHLSKSARAVLAARYARGELPFLPTAGQAASTFDVSPSYAHLAQRLAGHNVLERAVICGRMTLAHALDLLARMQQADAAQAAAQNEPAPHVESPWSFPVVIVPSLPEQPTA
jgi:hypothetical protein